MNKEDKIIIELMFIFITKLMSINLLYLTNEGDHSEEIKDAKSEINKLYKYIDIWKEKTNV